MKRLTQGLIGIIVVCAILGAITYKLNHAEGLAGKNTLSLYNWGDYIDESLLKDFQKQTGIKVVLETFDSNEAMLTKIQQGGSNYDIAVPSEYMVNKMAEENLLLPLDKKKLPNFRNLDKRFLDLPFDPGNKYSIPYFWGTVGIAYNTKMLPNKSFNSWEDLWDPALKNDILLTDGSRETIGMGLNALGYSLNDTNEAHLLEAKAKLDTLMPNVKAIVGDEARMLLANNEAPVSICWSGVASEIIDENPDLDYVVPDEGSNLWFDNIVIPKTAKNVDAAYKFIDFMLDAKVNAQNAEYVTYSTPNKAALEYMPKKMTEDKRFYPTPEMTENLEVYKNLGQEKLTRYNELFLQFKMATK